MAAMAWRIAWRVSGGGVRRQSTTALAGPGPLWLSPALEARVRDASARCAAVRARLDSEEAATLPPDELAEASKEVAQLAPLAAAYEELARLKTELGELRRLADESGAGADAELAALAQEEMAGHRRRLQQLQQELLSLLVPRDAADEASAIVEVRAGTGGGEAAIFARELTRMYERYAALKGWRYELMNVSQEETAQGFREATASVSGRGVFGRLKHESGTHRVQRVPVTEANGRVHTSTATVAILPQPSEVQIDVREEDLRIEVYRASGAGGQHVNKTESAVRITHVPTGVVVAMQDERSQHKNKERAMKILRARLFEAERQRVAAQRRLVRNEQIGTGERSEKIRTYNIPQNRVTDHRIDLSVHGVTAVLDGSALDRLADALIADAESRALADLSS